MWDNLIKARWQTAFDQPPTGKHLEAFRAKMAKDKGIEAYIKNTTDDELIAILRQVAKDNQAKDNQANPPPQSGATSTTGAKP